MSESEVFDSDDEYEEDDDGHEIIEPDSDSQYQTEDEDEEEAAGPHDDTEGVQLPRVVYCDVFGSRICDARRRCRPGRPRRDRRRLCRLHHSYVTCECKLVTRGHVLLGTSKD
jgi:hypothetical protein